MLPCHRISLHGEYFSNTFVCHCLGDETQRLLPPVRFLVVDFHISVCQVFTSMMRKVAAKYMVLAN